MKNEDLYHLHRQGIISHLDFHFARFMARLSCEDNPQLTLAAALVSSYTRQGHICLDLSNVAEKPLSEGGDGRAAVTSPELITWCQNLRESGVVGEPGELKPLIIDDCFRLYLFRYWDYQEKLAEMIMIRACQEVETVGATALREGLDRLFAGGRTGGIDWQKVAAATALLKRFCVISGGPGTGKTTTVAKILGLILEEANTAAARIALAAPTGKAAVRLQESVRQAKETLNCEEGIREAIPEEASTIHRLLGSVPDSPYFRYKAGNPLPVDVVIVDEASMVDLPLMSKLVQALPPQARLVLLGDRDQLASVEAGAALGDICDTGCQHGFSKKFCGDLEKVTGYKIHTESDGEEESGIRDCIVQLHKGYRFGGGSGIGVVSRAVNEGEGDLALSLMTGGKYTDIEWHDLPRPDALRRSLRDTILGGFGGYLKSSDPIESFQLSDRFRILCALREGPYGVAALNRLVEEILRAENLIKPCGKWYAGEPVLITRNDYNLRLFNGDVGIILPDPEASQGLRAFFLSPDGELRKFHPVRLPAHETAYALTVHKSQGSEFERVLLLLTDRESPVLTRELIYTGMTRARDRVEIWGSGDVFRNAVARRIERTSGLRDALWTER